MSVRCRTHALHPTLTASWPPTRSGELFNCKHSDYRPVYAERPRPPGAFALPLTPASGAHCLKLPFTTEIVALQRPFGACDKLPATRLTQHGGRSHDTRIVRRPAAGNSGLLGSRDTAGLQCRENPCGNSNWHVKNGGTGMAGGPLLDPARQNGGPRARAAAGNYDLSLGCDRGGDSAA